MMTRQTDLTRPDRFDAATLLGVLEREGERIVATAREHGPEPRIPFCPGWTMRDLVAHLGFVYRWARTIVTERRSGPPSAAERAALADPEPDDWPGAVDRLAQAHTQLLAALHEAAPSLDCWTMWPFASRDFWIRRQAHETLVHRVDADNAVLQRARRGTELDAAVADDGVDEMVCGFANRYREHLRADRPCTLALHACDTGNSWWIRLGSTEPEFGRGPAPTPVDTTVRAGSGELLLLLWNRRTADGLAVHGDHAVLQTWNRDAHL